MDRPKARLAQVRFNRRQLLPVLGVAALTGGMLIDWKGLFDPRWQEWRELAEQVGIVEVLADEGGEVTTFQVDGLSYSLGARPNMQVPGGLFTIYGQIANISGAPVSGVGMGFNFCFPAAGRMIQCVTEGSSNLCTDGGHTWRSPLRDLAPNEVYVIPDIQAQVLPEAPPGTFQGTCVQPINGIAGLVIIKEGFSEGTSHGINMRVGHGTYLPLIVRRR